MRRKNLTNVIPEKYWSFTKFGLVGLSNTAISLIVYSAFVYFGVHYQIANIAAFVLSSLNGFLLNRTWVFKAKNQSFLGQGLRYYIIYCSSLLISMALSYVWIEIFHIDKYIVPFLNLVVTIPYNYLFNKLWAFKVPQEQKHLVESEAVVKVNDKKQLNLRISERYPNFLKETVLYSALIAIVLIVFVAAYPIVLKDLRVPYMSSGDTIFGAQTIKTIMETGWDLFNPDVGAPFGQSMIAFPNSDGLSLLIIKIMGLFIDDCFVIMNLFYILTYILVAVISFFSLRKMKVLIAPAFVASILFTYLPYHLMRSEGHLFLSAYFMIPLIMLMAYRILDYEDWREESGTREKWGLVAIGLAASSTGVYYAFFSFVVLAFCAIVRITKTKSFASAKGAYLLLATLAFGVAINVSPTLWYMLTQSHVGLTRRGHIESEIYGLKIIQLLMPRKDGSMGLLTKVSNRYNNPNITPLVNENAMASLGLFGTFGFLAGLAILAFAKNHSWNREIKRLSSLNIFMVFGATIGGFGSVLALMGFTWIRAYNRISVFIAFISIFISATMLSIALSRLRKGWKMTTLSAVTLGLILVLGLKDQVKFPEIGSEALKKGQDADRAYFTSLQSLMPTNAMILQLPYIPFPENPPVHMMFDYDHFRPYLHTKGIRWSYGVMKGSEGDSAIRRISFLPPDQLIEAASSMGYTGILINTLGYEDRANSQIETFQNILKTNALVGNNFAFFTLEQNGGKKALSEENWKENLAKFEDSLRKIQVGQMISFKKGDDQADVGQNYLTEGFSGMEPWGVWSNGRSSIMSFSVNPEDNVSFSFQVQPFLPKAGLSLSVTVKMSGTILDVWEFKSGEVFPTNKTLTIQKAMMPADGRLFLHFEYSKTNSPARFGMSSDPRQLALGFISVTRN